MLLGLILIIAGIIAAMLGMMTGGSVDSETSMFLFIVTVVLLIAGLILVVIGGSTS